MKHNLQESFKKTIKSLFGMIPILLGTILLVSLVSTFFPANSYAKLFSGNIFLDPFIGSLAGSILAGNPITSFIIGGELLQSGISLIAITAFLVSWVTVGIISLPSEGFILGKKFAIIRNFSAFIFSIFVAILTVFLVTII